MSRVHNGPARNKPKGTTQPPVATDPTVCLCPDGRPIPIGTFVDQVLVDVERRHLRSTGCGKPSEHIEPQTYQADLVAGRR